MNDLIALLSQKNFPEGDYKKFYLLGDSCFESLLEKVKAGSFNSVEKCNAIKVLGVMCIQACPDKRPIHYELILDLLNDSDIDVRSLASRIVIGKHREVHDFPEVYNYPVLEYGKLKEKLHEAIRKGVNPDSEDFIQEYLDDSEI